MEKRAENRINKYKNPFTVQEGKFSFSKLKDNYYHTSWTEHAFLSDSNEKEAVGQQFDFRHIKIIKNILFIFFAILIIRIVWLQIFSYDHYYSLAEINRSRQEVIEAKRGIFYDRNGQALVRNTVNFVLSIRLIDLPFDTLKRDEVIREIAKILDGIEDNSNDNFIIEDGPSFLLIKEALAKVRYGSLESYQATFIKENIDYNRALSLILRLDELPGVIISSKIKRDYIHVDENHSSLSHILGYTGKISESELLSYASDYLAIDYIGKTGLERVWESELRGSSGRRSFEVDAYGRRNRLINEDLAISGFNLNLSIDLDLQLKTEEILKKWLNNLNLDKGSIVIINPKNGEILALVSLPAYNNNTFAQGISLNEYQNYLEDLNRPLFNRAIGGEFPAGSTIKPLISAAALEEGIITENTRIMSTGGIRIGQWFFPDWRYGGHGLTDVRKAIADSVNTFYYHIGGGYQDFKGLGLDKLVKYSRLFGLGEKTQIDLTGEASGLVPTREWRQEVKNEAWYIGNTYHFSIGQGDLSVTPLQVANFVAAIANGGKLYKPRIVKEIIDENDNLVRKIEAEIIRENFIDPYNLQVVSEGMRQTVLSGSGRRLLSLPVSSAGKTGTAQWSSLKDPHAWYSGFAPYENPEIAFAILVEEGREGSEVAVSIAHDILNWYFSEEEKE